MVRGGYHLNSDHWPIDGSLRLERRELWGTVNHDEFSQRGWVPKTEAKQNFMRGVAKDLWWMNEEARPGARLWCQLRRSSTLMQLGLTLTTLPYDSGVDFKSTGNALQISGPHGDKKLHATSASACAVTYVGS